MGTRQEITAGLSELLEKRLRHESRRFAREVVFYKPKCRIDYVAFKPAPWGWSEPGGIERGALTCYEVKSCVADYNSGHGLNFIGDEKYLVMPMEVANQLRGRMRNGIGIYVPVPRWSNVYREMETPTPYTGQVEGWSLYQVRKADGYYPRQVPLTVALAAMIYAGVDTEALFGSAHSNDEKEEDNE